MVFKELEQNLLGNFPKLNDVINLGYKTVELTPALNIRLISDHYRDDRQACKVVWALLLYKISTSSLVYEINLIKLQQNLSVNERPSTFGGLVQIMFFAWIVIGVDPLLSNNHPWSKICLWPHFYCDELSVLGIYSGLLLLCKLEFIFKRQKVFDRFHLLQCCIYIFHRKKNKIFLILIKTNINYIRQLPSFLHLEHYMI